MNFFDQIYRVVRKIPEGKVATYGEIALLVTEKLKNLKTEKQITPRLVGMALHKNPDPKNIPCHRVVDRNGKLAENYAFAWSSENRPMRRERPARNAFSIADAGGIEPRSRKGRLGGEGWKEQKRKLLEEGVLFKDLPAQAGKMNVDLKKSLWKEID